MSSFYSHDHCSCPSIMDLNSQRQWQQVQEGLPGSRADGVLTLRQGRLQSLIKNLSPIDSTWKWKPTFLQWSPTVYTNHSWQQVSYPAVDSLLKINSTAFLEVFCLIVICLGIFTLLVFCLYITVFVVWRVFCVYLCMCMCFLCFHCFLCLFVLFYSGWFVCLFVF